MGFEYGEVAKLKENLIALNKKSHEVHLKVAKRIAQLAIRKVKKMTPVDTGDLRNNWKYHIVKKGDTYTILVYNQLHYASYVELGRRIVDGDGNTKGWREGYFMLKLTKDKMNKIAPTMWKKEVEKEMRRIFGN